MTVDATLHALTRSRVLLLVILGQLPEDVLAKLPVPSADAIAAGLAAMVGMVSSPYDDVAVNGCASVAKLAAASERTRFSMAQSRELISALQAVALGDTGNLSTDTRTNAALALSELLVLPVGQLNFLECVGVGVCGASTAAAGSPGCAASVLTRLADATAVCPSSAVAEFELVYFRHYWCVVLCVYVARRPVPLLVERVLLRLYDLERDVLMSSVCMWCLNEQHGCTRQLVCSDCKCSIRDIDSAPSHRQPRASVDECPESSGDVVGLRSVDERGARRLG